MRVHCTLTSYMYHSKSKLCDEVTVPNLCLCYESACGLAEQSRTHKRKVVSSSPISASVFVSLGKILNLACLVYPSDMWVAVMGMSQFNVR